MGDFNEPKRSWNADKVSEKLQLKNSTLRVLATKGVLSEVDEKFPVDFDALIQTIDKRLSSNDSGYYFPDSLKNIVKPSGTDYNDLNPSGLLVYKLLHIPFKNGRSSRDGRGIIALDPQASQQPTVLLLEMYGKERQRTNADVPKINGAIESYVSLGETDMDVIHEPDPVAENADALLQLKAVEAVLSKMSQQYIAIIHNIIAQFPTEESLQQLMEMLPLVAEQETILQFADEEIGQLNAEKRLLEKELYTRTTIVNVLLMQVVHQQTKSDEDIAMLQASAWTLQRKLDLGQRLVKQTSKITPPNNKLSLKTTRLSEPVYSRGALHIAKHLLSKVRVWRPHW